MITEDDATESSDRAALIHREIVQLGILIVVAVAIFFVTRAVAASNRAIALRDAAEWYSRGQAALSGGRVEIAVEDLRRATARNRHERSYALALARALTIQGEDDAARGVLLTLRESEPEDPEVNLALARLAARRGDTADAVRFYQNALYAPWAAEQAGARRQVRFEIVDFLLAHDQAARAQSELLAIVADLPDQVGAHLQVAQLFARAGDDNHALDQFQRALRLAPDNGAALAGAGRSAFQLGQYALARAYLRRAPADLENVATARDVAEQVISHDPLAARIGPAERRRRLTAAVEYAHQRLTACVAQRSGAPPAGDEILLGETARLNDRLKRGIVLDQDTIETGVDLAARAAQRVAEACGTPTPLDRALVLIERQHNGESK